MAGEALGLVEVRGMLGAVVAADAALKAANVSLITIEPVKAGLRTVELTGDVAAVKAAVDAAVAAVSHMDCYLSSHVIARVDEQTKHIYGPVETKQVDSVDDKEDSEVVETAEIIETVEQVEVLEETVVLKSAADELVETEEVVEEIVETTLINETPEVDEVIEGKKEHSSHKLPYTREQLEAMKVVKLREIAYRHPNISLTKKQIKFGNKETLINALLQ